MTDAELDRLLDPIEAGHLLKREEYLALVAEVREIRSLLYKKWERLCEVLRERDEALAEVRRLREENERLRGLIFDDSPITPEEEAWARSVVAEGG